VSNHSSTESSSADSGLDLFELVSIVWREKLTFALVVAFCTTIGLAYALLATPIYKAEVIMTPSGQRAPSAALGQLGGLAALAGVSLGSERSAMPLAVLKSREFAQDFIADEQLASALVEDSPFRAKQLDVRDALEVFLKNVLVVTEDKKAGTVTVAMYWEDAEIAARWANQYVQRLNDRLRARALAESERNVQFLQKEIANTSVVSVQQSVGRILEAEMQQYMLAKGDIEYAYKVVDRASPPKRRESPKRALVVLLSGLFGGVLGVFAVIVKTQSTWVRRVSA
jgi:uncharacterized protein involved in exopolysaccharide biosynthesis